MNFLILEFISSFFYIYLISLVYVQFENLLLVGIANFIIIWILTTIGKSDNIFFNLTITLSFLIFKKETINKSILRILSQIIGSAFGFAVFMLCSNDIKLLPIIPSLKYSMYINCIYEMISLIIITTWVLSTSFNNEKDNVYRSFIYALLNFLITILFRNVSGNSFNFYLNLFTLIYDFSHKDYFFSYLIAHLTGIIIGGILNKQISTVKKYSIDYRNYINN